MLTREEVSLFLESYNDSRRTAVTLLSKQSGGFDLHG